MRKRVLQACAYLIGIGISGYIILLMLRETADPKAAPVANRSESPDGSVSAALTPYHPDCPSHLPLRVAIRNGGKETVSKVSFNIRARKKGYSTWLTASYGFERPRYGTDKFIQPGEKYEMCVEEPEILSNERPSAFETEYFIDLVSAELGSP